LDKSQVEQKKISGLWHSENVEKGCSQNRCSVQRQSPRCLPFVGLTAIFACSATFRTDMIFVIDQKNDLNNYPIGIYHCKKWSKTILHWYKFYYGALFIK